jgi:demethylmenaquinone methyltransferase/2-methoxy-6-polyprenyl-1,4-benzoquinol methylase
MQYTAVSTEVRTMFGSIAQRYDLTNSVLSLGIHHAWRRALINLLPVSTNHSVLDLCTGTGNLLPLLQKRFGPVVGADFCMPMLIAGKNRFAGSGKEVFPVAQADGLSLPFAENTFDIVTVAFGVRNFEKVEVGLGEIRRVLKTGGHLLVLEFGQPKIPVWAQFYQFYSKHIMPLIGGLLTGNRHAYTYLPQTAKNFPCGDAFKALLERCGYSTIKAKSLTGGIAYVYDGQKL